MNEEFQWISSIEEFYQTKNYPLPSLGEISEEILLSLGRLIQKKSRQTITKACAINRLFLLNTQQISRDKKANVPFQIHKESSDRKNERKNNEMFTIR